MPRGRPAAGPRAPPPLRSCAHAGTHSPRGRQGSDRESAAGGRDCQKQISTWIWSEAAQMRTYVVDVFERAAPTI
eukprot:6200823-Pleurochrysis_carterae.AAC.1